MATADQLPDTCGGDAPTEDDEFSITEKKTGLFFKETKRGRGRIKHKILETYLGAFLPILGFHVPRTIMYVDGFSGAGIYESETGVEKGSPLIAYETAINHPLVHDQRFKGHIKLIFIEFLKKNSDSLKNELRKIDKADAKVAYEVHCCKFEDKMKDILQREAPETAILVFADPFGYKGIPMELMQQIVERRWTELIINVMYGSALRWFKNRKLQPVFSDWLGLEEGKWKAEVLAKKNDTPKKRRESFMNLYIRQLKIRNDKAYALKFSLKDRSNRFIYSLIHVTSHILGLKNMKINLWKSSQTDEELSFSEWVEEEETRATEKMDQEEIAAEIVTRVLSDFAGSSVSGQEIENYIYIETPYICNKNSLKKAFKEVGALKATGAFDKLQFQF